MSRVATVLTVATPAQLLGAFVRALPSSAPKVAAAILTAQAEVETANGRAMHNWNPGNVTVSATSSADWVLQGQLTLHFASYPDLATGAAAMVAWLARNGALPYALAGDLNGYMNALQAGCYLGCVGQGTVTQTDYTNYQAGISARLPGLLALVPDFSLASPGLSGGDWALIVATAVIGGVVLADAWPAIRRTGALALRRALA